MKGFGMNDFQIMTTHDISMEIKSGRAIPNLLSTIVNKNYVFHFIMAKLEIA